MNFEEALANLKKGHLAGRMSWTDGKLLYLVKSWIGAFPVEAGFSAQDVESGVGITPFLIYKDTKGKAAAYNISNEDLLAEDWTVRQILSKVEIDV